MKTAIEVDRDGVRQRVYHRAGTLTVDGIKRTDERYAWTHPLAERETCVACTKGTIPADVQSGTRSAT